MNQTLIDLEICNSIENNNLEKLTDLIKNYNYDSLSLPFVMYRLSDEQIIAIAKGLKYNTKIIILGLVENNMTDIGAIILAECLSFNTTLKKIYLMSNQITDIGAEAFVKLLKINPTLIHIPLYMNHVSIAMQNAISNQIFVNIHNSKVKNISLQQLCYKIIKNNNIHCPESYKTIYEKIELN